MHIRLRLHLKDIKNIGEVVSRADEYFQQYLICGLISKLQTNTYKRELTRYGNNSIVIAESFFYIDSVATLEMLGSIDGEDAETLRWKFAIRSIDDLLNNFQFNINKKLTLLEQLKTVFINEHGGSKELKLQLDNKYRKLKKQVEDILNRTLDAEPKINTILKWKNKQISILADSIFILENNGELEMELGDLLSSYIHMMLNRIFMGRQRTNELVIYDMLNRYYKSQIARSKIKL